MEFEFVISTHSFKLQRQYFCNLNKGDMIHAGNEYLHYSSGKFTFVNYDNYLNPHEEMLDYTVLPEGELFQQSLVFDKKYICSFEDVCALQKIIKEYDKSISGRDIIIKEYKFNLEDM